MMEAMKTVTYVRLSNLVSAVKPNRRAAYVKAFRMAIIAGDIWAVLLADVFKIPVSKKAKADETTSKPSRSVADFSVQKSADFDAWHDATVERVQARNSRAPSFADLERGKIDFEVEAAKTKAKLEAQKSRQTKTKPKAK